MKFPRERASVSDLPGIIGTTAEPFLRFLRFLRTFSEIRGSGTTAGDP
jgi:hypothetical protein